MPVFRGLVGRAQDFSTRYRSYLLNGSADVLAAGCGLLSSVMLSRGLGPEGRGQLAAALLWPTLVATAVSLGLPHAVAYHAAALKASTRHLARMGVFIGAIGGVAGAAVYFAIAPALLRSAFPVLPAGIRLFSCFIPLSLWAGLWMALFQGRGDFGTWTLAKAWRSVGYTAWIACALALGIGSVSVVLWSQVAIAIVTLVLLGSRIGRIAPADHQEAMPFSVLLKYGLAVYASTLLYTLNLQLDQLLLSLLVPAGDLGQYTSAASVSAVALFIPGAMGPVTFSRLASSSREQWRPHAADAVKTCVVTAVPTAALLTVCAPAIVRVAFGPSFGPAGQLLRVLLPAATLLGLANLLGDILRGSGKPLVPVYAAALGVCITLPGLAFSLPRWGIWGAAWVSLVAYGAMLAFQAVRISRQLRTS